MRLRKVKNALETLNECESVVEAQKYKGKWKELFNNDNPIHIEIGMGKGKFITTLAKKNPNINYIGIEKFDSVLVRATEKEIPSNLKLTLLDANFIMDAFDECEIDRIYLNFSDPWPKSGYKKRRLTHEEFLKKYHMILDLGGKVIFKTDNRKLFEYSLISMNNFGMKFNDVSLDLHNSEIENIMTEYEEKFSKFGPIYRIEAEFDEINKD